MNAAADTQLKSAELEEQTARREQGEPQSHLIEMGKVSETKGSWLGAKTDVGAGFVYY